MAAEWGSSSPALLGSLGLMEPCEQGLPPAQVPPMVLGSVSCCPSQVEISTQRWAHCSSQMC